MSGFSKTMLVVLVLAVFTSLAEANSTRRSDMATRQAEIGDKRVPVKPLDLQKHRSLNDQRIPIKQWHGEFNSIGQRRAPIDVRETSEKRMIRPEVIETRKTERRIAPQNRRMAHVRNFDQVRENQLVPKYRDAEVATVQQMSRPAPSNKKDDQPLTMRDINRFSFQRNHPDAGGPKVDQAGSGESSPRREEGTRRRD